MKPPLPTPNVEGKVIYLLAFVVIVQTIYPITSGGSLALLIVYQSLYASLIVVGIVLARDTPGDARLLTSLGIVWAVAGLIYALNQDAFWAVLLGYAALVPFIAMVIRVLLRYIFRTAAVNRDVLFAASAVYLLLGAVFVPIYGSVEVITLIRTGAHAFSDATFAADAFIPWQTLIYYSYATLTTMGYGDVLPVTPWSRSLASLEAIIGVLYITVIMARLVGLYAASDIEGEHDRPTRPGGAL